MQLCESIAAILTLMPSAGLAQVDDAAPIAGSTLNKIVENDVIVVGRRESSVPSSYYDNRQKVVGHLQDYSNTVIEIMEKKLNEPDLQVRLIPIVLQNRIPLLQGDTSDFECGSTTNNTERRKQTAFFNTVFMVDIRLLIKKDSDIRDFADLKGRAIVATSGTTSEVLLNELDKEQKMDVQIVGAKGRGGSFRTPKSGRAIAFVMDDVLLAGERVKAKKPDNWKIIGKPRFQEAYDCVLRRGGPRFKKPMDDTIAQVRTSNEVEEWFGEWLKNPIPPKNLSMNFGLLDEMKALFKKLNDRAPN